MKCLPCDIRGNKKSTSEFLAVNAKELSRQEFVRQLKEAICDKAKTRPLKMARRLGSLIGVTYDQLGGDTYILDCIIEAFQAAEKGTEMSASLSV